VGQSGELEVGNQIDAMSGATITSKAVTEGVNAAVETVNGLRGGVQ
jgi:Na+-translocating ferredoxin:NAD+ oxidoreductase RnfG subunit